MAITHGTALYTAAQSRALDALAAERLGLDATTLMERAGTAAQRVLRRRWTGCAQVVVVCGVGNNAGDGYVLARHLHADGVGVRVLQVGDAARLTDAAHRARAAYQSAGGVIESYQHAALGKATLIVDALFGTGLARPIEGDWRAVVEDINAADAEVFALDIPSGLSADTGQPLGLAVRAQLTLGFIAHKQGLFTGAARDHAGERLLDDLDLPATLFDAIIPAARLLDVAELAAQLPPRMHDTHKGDCGRVLVIGGDRGMPGAVRLAGEAALRAGAGLVTLATRETHAAELASACPELLAHGCEDLSTFAPLLAAHDVLALGPGLGRGEWSRASYAAALACGKPLVVDADALNLLAQAPQQRHDWILTPHPGEAARLLGVTTAEIQGDRYVAVRALQERYGGVVVLKGSGTLIADAASVWCCSYGNPGMASAGMGDVLTGVIAALLAQGLSLSAAARVGVLVHARAGDTAASVGERGLMARDVIAALRTQVNPPLAC
jgi:NAD(P)H-hydrate epimerase